MLFGEVEENVVSSVCQDMDAKTSVAQKLWSSEDENYTDEDQENHDVSQTTDLNTVQRKDSPSPDQENMQVDAISQEDSGSMFDENSPIEKKKKKRLTGRKGKKQKKYTASSDEEGVERMTEKEKKSLFDELREATDSSDGNADERSGSDLDDDTCAAAWDNLLVEHSASSQLMSSNTQATSIEASVENFSQVSMVEMEMEKYHLEREEKMKSMAEVRKTQQEAARVAKEKDGRDTAMTMFSFCGSGCPMWTQSTERELKHLPFIRMPRSVRWLDNGQPASECDQQNRAFALLRQWGHNRETARKWCVAEGFALQTENFSQQKESSFALDDTAVRQRINVIFPQLLQKYAAKFRVTSAEKNELQRLYDFLPALQKLRKEKFGTVSQRSSPRVKGRNTKSQALVEEDEKEPHGKVPLAGGRGGMIGEILVESKEEIVFPVDVCDNSEEDKDKENESTQTTESLVAENKSNNTPDNEPTQTTENVSTQNESNNTPENVSDDAVNQRALDANVDDDFRPIKTIMSEDEEDTGDDDLNAVKMSDDGMGMDDGCQNAQNKEDSNCKLMDTNVGYVLNSPAKTISKSATIAPGVKGVVSLKTLFQNAHELNQKREEKEAEEMRDALAYNNAIRKRKRKKIEDNKDGANEEVQAEDDVGLTENDNSQGKKRGIVRPLNGTPADQSQAAAEQPAAVDEENIRRKRQGGDEYDPEREVQRKKRRAEKAAEMEEVKARMREAGLIEEEAEESEGEDEDKTTSVQKDKTDLSGGKKTSAVDDEEDMMLDLGDEVEGLIASDDEDEGEMWMGGDAAEMHRAKMDEMDEDMYKQMFTLDGVKQRRKHKRMGGDITDDKRQTRRQAERVEAEEEDRWARDNVVSSDEDFDDYSDGHSDDLSGEEGDPQSRRRRRNRRNKRKKDQPYEFEPGVDNGTTHNKAPTHQQKNGETSMHQRNAAAVSNKVKAVDIAPNSLPRGFSGFSGGWKALRSDTGGAKKGHSGFANLLESLQQPADAVPSNGQSNAAPATSFLAPPSSSSANPSSCHKKKSASATIAGRTAASAAASLLGGNSTFLTDSSSLSMFRSAGMFGGGSKDSILSLSKSPKDTNILSGRFVDDATSNSRTNSIQAFGGNVFLKSTTNQRPHSSGEQNSRKGRSGTEGFMARLRQLEEDEGTKQRK